LSSVNEIVPDGGKILTFRRAVFEAADAVCVCAWLSGWFGRVSGGFAGGEAIPSFPGLCCRACFQDGMTIDEIIEQNPVSREEIKAVFDFASHSHDKGPSF
jgi:hypothetical protein